MPLKHLKRMPHALAVMTAFPYSVDIDAPIRAAEEMMAEHQIRHLPVKENGKLVSVVTDRDLRRAHDPTLGLPPTDELRVRHACVIDAYIVDINESLDNVLLHMAEQHIGSALVTKEGHLVGIFTSMDACRYLGELLRHEFPRPTGGGNEAA